MRDLGAEIDARRRSGDLFRAGEVAKIGIAVCDLLAGASDCGGGADLGTETIWIARDGSVSLKAGTRLDPGAQQALARVLLEMLRVADITGRGGRRHRALWAAVLRALSPEPQTRYPDLEAFARALARGLDPAARVQRFLEPGHAGGRALSRIGRSCQAVARLAAGLLRLTGPWLSTGWRVLRSDSARPSGAGKGLPLLAAFALTGAVLIGLAQPTDDARTPQEEPGAMQSSERLVSDPLGQLWEEVSASDLAARLQGYSRLAMASLRTSVPPLAETLRTAIQALLAELGHALDWSAWKEVSIRELLPALGLLALGVLLLRWL